MVIFPPDPLLRTTFCQLLCFYSNQQFLANTKDYRIATGSQRFVQNTFTARTETLDEDDDNVQTVMTQMAALTTQSQQTAHTAAKTSASVAAAINQPMANQQTMQQQFSAFTKQHNKTYQWAQAVQPPITQFSIPNFASFPTESCGGGRRGGIGRGGHANFVRTGGRNVRTPFADFVGCGGQGGLPPISGGGGQGGGLPFFMQHPTQHNVAPQYSNILKKYANWKVCFSCGFDVKDGHTSKTCPAPWRQANHQEGFDRSNASEYITAGYGACTKAMHKSKLPNM
jgi:hypothetical protein